jgi:hypothetical protein
MDKVINVKCDVNFEVFTVMLKNIQVFCDVRLMCHDISEVFLDLKIEAMCTVCKYYRLRRRNISQKTVFIEHCTRFAPWKLIHRKMI